MDDMERLWTLLAELSNQLSLNRQHCDALRRQAEDLKQQAVHVGTGFTLRRFNTDISKGARRRLRRSARAPLTASAEVFESELERLNATLVLENHSLQHENKQLSMLLKDYEGTLENIMGRFRSFAVRRAPSASMTLG
jgi:ABC-type phosphate transport system auxiliary subunit